MSNGMQAGTILIVDDTQTSRLSARLILARENYQIYCLDSAAQLFQQIDTIRPDVILMDAMMPEIDGFDACRTCKATEAWAHIPIIMVTGLSDPNTLSKAIDAGADDFVAKPLQAIELSARVRSAIRIKRQFDALQETITLRDQLSHILVHDMRNPLQTMSLYADIGKRASTHPKALKAFDLVKSQTEELQALVNDMLTAARIEHGQLAIQPERVEIKSMAEQALGRIEALAAQSELTLAVKVAINSAEICADRRLLERVLDNLLSNALKYAPVQSTIGVDIRPCSIDGATAIAIDVSDEGAGVPLSERDRIFDKFSIGSVRSQRGTRFGLGLPFCKLVVEAHGGELRLHDNRPTGSIFSVVLPLDSLTDVNMDAGNGKLPLTDCAKIAEQAAAVTSFV